jgi:hypothetical protein
MRLCRAIGKGESPDSDEAADGLMSLNALVDHLATQRLMVYRISITGVPVTAGVYDYSITSLFDTTDDVPIRWDRGTNIELDGIHYDIEPIEAVQYGKISNTALTGRPTQFWFRKVPPDVRITIWPVPDSDCTLWLHAWTRLQKFSALTTVVQMPPGYLQMLAYSLAEAIAPEYGMAIDPAVAAMAARARQALVAVNAPRLRAEMNPDMARAGLYRDQWFDIRSGY